MMRRSPIQQGGPLERKKPMAGGTGFNSPVTGAFLLRFAATQAKARASVKKPAKLPKPTASWGMKGRPTADEARFIDAIAALGQHRLPEGRLAQPGRQRAPHRQLHKAGCAPAGTPTVPGHHQYSTGAIPTLIAVHPYEARFEERYGAQRALLAECIAMLKTELKEAA